MEEKRMKPKGILKNSSSFDTPMQHNPTHNSNKSTKETKWDEMNIIATLHPPDKDYGHMKVDEPKTPYNYLNEDTMDGLDADELAKKIAGSIDPPKALQHQDDDEEDDEDDEDDADLTPEEKEKKRQFESKRKKHYNEYYAVKLARKLMLEEGDEDDDNNQCCSK